MLEYKGRTDPTWKNQLILLFKKVIFKFPIRLLGGSIPTTFLPWGQICPNHPISLHLCLAFGCITAQKQTLRWTSECTFQQHFLIPQMKREPYPYPTRILSTWIRHCIIMRCLALMCSQTAVCVMCSAPSGGARCILEQVGPAAKGLKQYGRASDYLG